MASLRHYILQGVCRSRRKALVTRAFTCNIKIGSPSTLSSLVGMRRCRSVPTGTCIYIVHVPECNSSCRRHCISLPKGIIKTLELQYWERKLMLFCTCIVDGWRGLTFKKHYGLSLTYPACQVGAHGQYLQ